VVRKIADEHRALNRLFATALKRLEGDEASGPEAGEVFENLVGSMESHLSAEENLYFPTIWALMPQFEERLRAFIRAHHHFRGLLQEITGLIDSGEEEEAAYVLNRLRHEFSRHEGSEQDALRSLDEEILSNESQ